MIAGLLHDFQCVFSKDENDLGYTHLVEHEIDTGDAKPVKVPPRRMPLAFAGEDLNAIQKLQAQGTIRPSSSPWAAPLVLVRKREGSVRPCVDFRALNSRTKKDAFPIPKTQDCLDALEGASLFSTLDITSAYNQIPVRAEDIAKTAFVSKYGLFEFTTMPFGLCNAPATFQRLMEVALSGLQWTSCLIYLDDVLIFGRSFDEHMARLRLVLQRIADANLKFKPKKCHFLEGKVVFLGHVVSKEGLLPNPDNIKKLVDWPVPETVTQVRALLGLGNYYRRFVKGFSQIAQPLTDLTKKGKTFIWDDGCQTAFERLKQALISPDIMAFPSETGQFILDTDASDRAIGAVLSQVHNDEERVIAYGSHVLNRAERNYCVTDRELLAVKHFILHYKHYLLGRKFLVRSDHQALRWLFSLKEPKSRIASWIELLSAFDFEVEYRAGRKHGNDDALSRCHNPRDCSCELETESLKCGPCPKCDKRSVEMHSNWQDSHETLRTARTNTAYQHFGLGRITWILTLLWVGLMFLCSLPSVSGSNTMGFQTLNTLRRSQHLSRGSQNPVELSSKWHAVGNGKRIRSLQSSDPDLSPILEWKKSGSRPYGPVVCGSSPATRHYWNLWDSLVMQDGILMREFTKKDCITKYLQLLVPAEMRKEVLYQMHNTLISGHLGRKKTREKVLQHYYWFGVRDDVNNWVRNCDTCASVKSPTQKLKAPMGSMPVGAPLDRLETDLMGPLPLTPRGNRFILVVTDYFTKWVEIFAVPDQSAITCAEIILNEVIARFGCCYDLHSDQGRNFESRIFAELCRLLEIRKTRTSPGNPKCNGQTERFNKTLIRMIKAYLKGQQTDWDRNLGCLAAAYRSSQHESTGMTPNLLMLGREVRLPAEIMFGSGTNHVGEEITSYGQYVDQLRERMQKAHALAREHLAAAAKRRKRDHDFKLHMHRYEAGDLAWYLTNKNQLATSPKLRRPYEGPYLVLHRISDLDYIIQFNSEGKKQLVNHDRLKPYEGEQKLKWAKTALQKYKKSSH